MSYYPPSKAIERKKMNRLLYEIVIGSAVLIGISVIAAVIAKLTNTSPWNVLITYLLAEQICKIVRTFNND